MSVFFFCINNYHNFSFLIVSVNVVSIWMSESPELLELGPLCRISEFATQVLARAAFLHEALGFLLYTSSWCWTIFFFKLNECWKKSFSDFHEFFSFPWALGAVYIQPNQEISHFGWFNVNKGECQLRKSHYFFGKLWTLLIEVALESADRGGTV